LTANTKDVACGLIFIALGAFFGFGALDLPLGTALRMGPGYFPLVLSGALVVIGGVLVVKALGKETDPFGVVPWRGLVLTVAAVAFFGFSVRGIGLVPALFIVCFASAFASRKMSLLFALILAAVMTAFCTLVFHTGLGLNIQLIGPWLSF
jgi:hypothetical protein